ncbi:acyl--CoA ligase family protein [Candidatus Nephthysia bennettiae]|uniref:Long-chain-fatty-acid--CoA ligase n=1 Tax=Candidatus Nephthysia bennettiae TaxID=3127016 RepID=A0A934NAH0_9BACT|nr:long-chain-fatty-acid--CoA ligase [Candidatus Dormibacteraeota bacterium]MBJ7612206.1 long-chain-fatty-acid--CoA ligase [Candidatus Dormibacteraeota bacterium]
MAVAEKGTVVYRQELTPTSFLERSGTVHAERTAVIDGDRRYSYREWRSRARRLASALRKGGLRKDDRVAFLAFNSEPLLLGHFGVPRAGGIIVAINTRLSPDEVAYILEHSGASMVFFSPELEGQLAKAPANLRRVNLGTEFEDFLATGSDDPVESWLEDEYEVLAIVYTSGTTGRPKGVMYHHRGAYLNALAMALDLRLDTRSRYLWTLPMFHCNGWTFTWGVTAVGATNVCIPRIDPPEVWKLFRSGQATAFCAAPTVLIMLVNDPAAARLETPVRLFTAGAPPSPTLIGQMDELNFQLEHVYGLTETYGPFTINVPPPGLEDLPPVQQALMRARQGVPNVTAGEVAVLDADGREVPPDGETMGEVAMRGNVVMKGYYADEEATETAFAGGWFHSGDVGVRHPDGHIELRDRKKDVIISGGENISTIEVEQAVMSHPAVLEAAVIAVPDERWGEVPKAFVTLKQGREVSADELKAHVRERLAHFKVPKSIEFGDLPKTSTGKVQKFVLRDKEWSGRDKRIN